jgi:hypothetical protein
MEHPLIISERENLRNVSPLSWCQPQEEQQTNQQDECDGTADVGRRPNSGDGHSLLRLHVIMRRG